MDAWNALIARIAEAGGVGTPADARAAGVPEATWHRRTRAERWGRPHHGVRVAPWAPDDRLTELRALLAACNGHGAAAGMTVLWLAGIREEPRRLDVMLPLGVSVPTTDRSRVTLRRARWLVDEDVQEVSGVARLRPEATLVSLAHQPRRPVRGAVIDLVQAGHTTPDRVLERLATVGPVRGRGQLEEVLLDLGARRPESWFHDVVLHDLLALGYPAATAPRLVETPDGRGVRLDIPIDPFLVAVEPEGDAFHHDRVARRNDRRRAGQVAGTPWVVVPVDWRDWHERREWLLQTVDAAILRQFHVGHGAISDLPPHLVNRVDPRHRA